MVLEHQLQPHCNWEIRRNEIKKLVHISYNKYELNSKMNVNAPQVSKKLGYCIHSLNLERYVS